MMLMMLKVEESEGEVTTQESLSPPLQRLELYPLPGPSTDRTSRSPLSQLTHSVHGTYRDFLRRERVFSRARQNKWPKEVINVSSVISLARLGFFCYEAGGACKRENPTSKWSM
jgi:hypothetical protein